MSEKLKNLLARAGVATSGLVLAGAAHADAGTDAIDALIPTANEYIAAAFGLAIVVAVGFWGIRMMRKAARAAS